MSKSSKISLLNIEIKYIMKVINSLENRGILLKAIIHKLFDTNSRFHVK